METKPFWASKTIGGSFAIILGLLLPMLGVSASPTEVSHWTDSLINCADAVITAGGILMTIYGRFAAKKPVSLTGAKAVIALLIGSLALFGPIEPLRAADVLPHKALPQIDLGTYPAGGCGFYYGVNAMGAGGAVNAGPIGATQIQGDIGATVGYGCPIGTVAGSFWFAEGNFDIANLNGSQNGLSLTGPAHFEQRFGVGGPISAMLNSGMFPNLNIGNGLSVPSLPGLPAGVTAGPSYPFLFASLHEEDVSAQIGVATGHAWLFSPGFGVGLQTRLSNNVVAETAAQWVLRSSGVEVGSSKVGLGNGAEVSFTLKY